MLNGIKTGQHYYSVIIFADGCQVQKNVNQNSPLEDARAKTGNYFKTESEAQNLADRINKAILKTKEGK